MREKKRVIVIGAGFGGLNAARKLGCIDAEVTLVDQNNHHLFQPLLYQVATAGLSPSQIAQPIRTLFSHQDHITVYQDQVKNIDLEKRMVKLSNSSLSYDYCVVATGAGANYFGHSDWASKAPSLKDIPDATLIRRKILETFEKAEVQSELDRADPKMNFIIIGGGPTGVELAGAISELSRVTLRRDFRKIDPSHSKVILIEAGERLLAGMHPNLSRKVKQKLEKMGVEVILGKRVTEIKEDSLRLDTDEKIESSFVIWAAGVNVPHLSQWFNIESKKSGKIPVEPDCSLPGHPEVFVIGDAADFRHTETGESLAGVAPVAIQQGRFVGKLIKDEINRGEKRERKKFKYFDKGMLATVGRTYAVGEVGKLRFSGLFGWFVWSLVHILYLVGFRNRIFVLLDWIWSYLTFQKGARLIIHR